ncbi:MAG: hypothetical protein G01um10145_556 [Microgenomates group bacterium Gr01-1014_5]|nr:MAG: hypothetical protein G01um10145_556 [Microgenomates group bacterium Gr01-1014_5]
MSWHEQEPQYQEAPVCLPHHDFFEFDPKNWMFIVRSATSGLRFEASPASDLVQDIWDLKVTQTTQKEIESNNPITPEPLLIMPLTGTLIISQSLRKWLKDSDQERVAEVFESTRKVIEAVCCELMKRQGISFSRRTAARFIKNDGTKKYSGGTFILNTVGSCACLGPNPYPTFMAYRDSPVSVYDDLSLPVEMVLHNADYPYQSLSLYAGAGTIAHFAREDMIKAGMLETA